MRLYEVIQYSGYRFVAFDQIRILVDDKDIPFASESGMHRFQYVFKIHGGGVFHSEYDRGQETHVGIQRTLDRGEFYRFFVFDEFVYQSRLAYSASAVNGDELKPSGKIPRIELIQFLFAPVEHNLNITYKIFNFCNLLIHKIVICKIAICMMRRYRKLRRIRKIESPIRADTAHGFP